MSPRNKSYLLFLIASIIWGIAGPVIKFTLGGISPLPFLVYRFLIASLVAIPILVLSGAKLPRGRDFWLMALYSFLTSTVALGLLFFGYDKSTALYGALLSASGPILIAIAGVWFLKETVTKREMVGIAIAFAGTIVTVFGPVLNNNNGEGGAVGNLLILASLLVGTITAVMGKILLRKGLSPLVLTNVSFVIGFLTILPAALSFHSLPSLLSAIYGTPAAYHLGVVYMALASGTLAYWLWHKAQKTIEVGEGGLFAYLYPVVSMPLAVFWLGENITMPFIVGAGIIVTGVVIAEYKKTKAKSRSQKSKLQVKT